VYNFRVSKGSRVCVSGSHSSLNNLLVASILSDGVVWSMQPVWLLVQPQIAKVDADFGVVLRQSDIPKQVIRWIWASYFVIYCLDMFFSTKLVGHMSTSVLFTKFISNTLPSIYDPMFSKGPVKLPVVYTGLWYPVADMTISVHFFIQDILIFEPQLGIKDFWGENSHPCCVLSSFISSSISVRTLKHSASSYR
jgi:hypothetical protein